MTTTFATSLPPLLRDYLRGFSAREGRIALLRAAGWGVALALAWTLAACLVDRVARLSEAARTALLLAGAAIVVGTWVRALVRTVGAYGHLLEAAAGIERQEPRFAQRLQTVVSQLTEREAYRASPEMLEQLVRQVLRQIERTRPRRRSPWRRILPPWLTAAAAAAVLGGLWFVPVLGMPRLLVRLTRPTSGELPATTTQINVDPGSVTLLQGQTLLVKASVRRLGGTGVDVLSSENGTLWTRLPMLPVSNGQYVLTLPWLERDLWYRVEAGDATSRKYRATVLRPPALAELRVHYEFPAYTQRSPLTISNSDGIIETLAGSRVRVTVVSTEPLASAQLDFGRTRLPLAATDDSHERQVEFTVADNGSAELDMTSEGGLTAKVPAALSIHAQVDRDPLVRLLEPATDLRLLPRAQVPLQYQAMDDYGLSTLALELQVNSAPVSEVAIARRGDARRQEGACVLDLARLNVKMGDVVTLRIVAGDGAGKKSVSESRRILVSPLSVDQNTHLRVADLKQAARITAATRDELRMAADWLEKARKLVGGADEDYVAARARLRGSLSNAVEASLLLHQALLRACARSGSRELTVALAECADAARVEAWLDERLVAMESAGETEKVLADALVSLTKASQQLAEWVRTLSEGEQAWVIGAERRNLRGPASQPSAGPARETIRSAEQEMTAALAELGLKPSARDLDAALQRRVDAERRFVQGRKPIDFELAAMQWRDALERGQAALPPLAQRLESAAEVEALWPEGDPVAARDLQLAGRAAERLAERRAQAAVADRAEVDSALAEFPGLVGVLQREHESSRLGRGAREDAAIDQLAVFARQKLAQWAMQGENAMIGDASGAVPAAEDLAMAASAATTQRDYQAAEAMDRKLVKLVSPEPWGAATQPALAQAMQAIRTIDQVSAEQKTISERTGPTADEAEAAVLSRQQQAVAEEIHRVDESDASLAPLAEDGDSRRAAMAAMQRVQAELAHMPQQMTAALSAAQACRRARARSDELRQAQQSLTGESLAVAQRAAEQAQTAARDADEEFKGACKGMDASAADAMAAAIAPFSPETDDARQWIAERLGPALGAFRESMSPTGDAEAAELASARLRATIDSSQWLLTQGQSKVIESDPLAAARWFAEAAAQALAATPPDISGARGQQDTASSALGRAWQDAVKDLASERLSLTPSMGPLLGGPSASLQTRGRSLGELLPGMRQWGFLRTRSLEGPGDGMSASGGSEAQPAGYQDALRVYFDYLNKVQQRGGKR